MNSDFDVIIVGGGLAGLSLAVALRASRLSVAVVEGRAPVAPAAPTASGNWDVRVYAVSPGNVRFLEEIGIWRHFDSARLAPVRTMEVFGDAGGRLDFSAYDSGVDALAWIVEASLMQRELWETAMRQGNVTLFCPARPQALEFDTAAARLLLDDGKTLTARLIVAADGADSWTRQAAGIGVDFQPYGQMGVVANFACARPHASVACQWFRADGVLAWLPLPGNMLSIVWSTLDAQAQELLSLPAEEFTRRVAEAGEWRFGELTLVTPPTAFPLRLMRAPRTIAPRLALIGDAAHTIHPLSGHGINLGFKDAQALAQMLVECPDFVDCGDMHWLRRYERSRIEEVVALQSTTHALQQLFQPQSPTLSWLRNSGLNLVNALPVVRSSLARYALD